MRTLLTEVLNNFTVNNKFVNDKFIIGNGQEEIITFKFSNNENSAGIRYIPEVKGERTFIIHPTDENIPMFNKTVTMYPYKKPTNNENVNYWILTEEDTIWISEEFINPENTTYFLIMFVGGTNYSDQNYWYIISAPKGTGEYNIDWDTASFATYYFQGNQQNITWENGNASAYPESINDWSQNGYFGVLPLEFSMNNTENQAAQVEFSNDGIIWNSFDSLSTININYEPIEFTETNLDSNGKLHIQHNFNNKNVLCLGYSVTPKDIEYQDNEIIFDYSDQSSISGAVWFVNSLQNMMIS